MQIKSKTTNTESLGRARKEMETAKAETAAAMKDLAARREAAGAKPGEGRVGGVHIKALMAAVQSEGPEVLSASADGWWNDMKRAYPWMCADGRVPDGNSLNGRYGRHGKVSRRYWRGAWWKWERGEWRPERITPGGAGETGR